MLIRTLFLVLVCGTRAQSLSAPFSYTLYIGKNEEVVLSTSEAGITVELQCVTIQSVTFLTRPTWSGDALAVTW
jgi:hypothetical protein